MKRMLLFCVIQRFPFEWKNPIGYLIAFPMEVILITCAAISGALATDIGIGINLILIAMGKDVEADMLSINQSITNHPKRSDIVKQFKDFVRFCSDSKQLSE